MVLRAGSNPRALVVGRQNRMHPHPTMVIGSRHGRGHGPHRVATSNRCCAGLQATAASAQDRPERYHPRPGHPRTAGPRRINAREVRRSWRLPGLRETADVAAAINVLVEARWLVRPQAASVSGADRAEDYVVIPVFVLGRQR